MKNLYSDRFLRGLGLCFLFFSMLFSAMSARADLSVSVRDNWNGTVEIIPISGNYVTLKLNGFNGTLLISELAGIIESNSTQPSLFSVRTDLSNSTQYVLQTSSETTAIVCVKYNDKNQSVIVTEGNCTGNIEANLDFICPEQEVSLTANISTTDYTIVWQYSDYDKGGNLLSSSENFESAQNKTTLAFTPATSPGGKVNFSCIFTEIADPTVIDTTYFTVYKKDMVDCYAISASENSVCPGSSVEIETSYTNGTEYVWYYKDSTETEWKQVNSDSLKSNGITNKLTYQEIGFSRSYKLEVDGVTFGEVSIIVLDCPAFIQPIYPVSSCLSSSNTLIASGASFTTAIKEGASFVWSYSYDGSNWIVIDGQTTYKCEVDQPQQLTYYQVKSSTGLKAEMEYPVPDCQQASYCQGLETKVLFNETFGYFTAADAYVSSNGTMYNGSMQLDRKVDLKNNDTYIGSGGDFSESNPYYDYYYHDDASLDLSNVRLSVDNDETTTISIHDFVAPDPNGYVVSPTNFVYGSSFANYYVPTDGHLFLSENPNIENYSWSNRPELRLQDGYYAIVVNADTCDQNGPDYLTEGDYSNLNDNSGSQYGAMLFVNAGETSTSKAAIYAQEVNFGCPADQFNFSMDVQAATYSTTDQNPVNLTILLLSQYTDAEKTMPTDLNNLPVLSVIQTGDISQNGWNTFEKFVQSSQKVDKLWVVIYNNGASGNGNDMLMDNIVFSVCLPKAELKTIIGNDTIKGELNVCKDTVIVLRANQTVNYLPDPSYLFQYFDSKTGLWTDVLDYEADNSLSKQDSIVISTSDKRFSGKVTYRVVIAGDYDRVRDVVNGENLSCKDYDSAEADFIINNTYAGPMKPGKDIPYCQVSGEKVVVIGERTILEGNENLQWKMFWKDTDGNILVDSTYNNSTYNDTLYVVVESDKSTLSIYDRNNVKVATKDTATLKYVDFLAYDEGGCEHTQRINLIAKPLVQLSAPVVSEVGCDSVIISVSKNPSSAVLSWDWSSVAGTAKPIDGVDTAQVFYPANIFDKDSINGTLVVSVSDPGESYCIPDPVSVPYTVYNQSFTISITPSSAPLCIAPGTNDDAEILQVTANVSPEDAINNIDEFSWHIVFSGGSVIDTITKSSMLSLKAAQLNDKTAQTMTIYVDSTTTSACGKIAQDTTASKVDIEIRDGGFSIEMDLSADRLCLLSDKTISVEAKFTPLTAMKNLASFNCIYGYGTGNDTLKVSTTSDSAYVINFDEANYQELLAAGNTAHFKISAYDSTCKGTFNSTEKDVVINGYSLDLKSMDNQCLALGDELPFTAQVSPSSAVNHISSYKWFVDGVEVKGDELSYSYIADTSTTTKVLIRTNDGICPEASDSVEFDVSVKYSVSLTTSSPTLCSEGNVVVNTVISPATSRKHIKRYEWHAKLNDGEDVIILNSSDLRDSVLVIDSVNYPSLIVPGGILQVYVVTDDSICDVVESSNKLSYDVNTPYDVTLEWDGSPVCIDYSTIKESSDSVLLTVKSLVDPENAIKHIKDFTWYVKAESESDAKAISTGNLNVLELTYDDLKAYIGQSISIYSSSYDNICTQSGDPELSNTINVDIRVGGFSLELAPLEDTYCASEDNVDAITLKAIVTPIEAEENITEYYWYNNDAQIAVTTVDSLVVDDATFTDVFGAGKTANFTVKAFDASCTQKNIDSENTETVKINIPFNLTLSSSFQKLCYDKEADQDIYLTANVTPSEAASHIQSYIWSRDSLVVQDTTQSNVYDVEQWLLPSHSLSFTVKAYDNICYTDESADGYVSMDVNLPFVPTLTVDEDKDTICSEGTVIELYTQVDQADALINSYSYSMQRNGGTYELLPNQEYGANDYYRFNSEDYPNGLVPGEILNFQVIVNDGGVCGPKESTVNVTIQTPFEIEIAATEDSICETSEVVLSIQSVTPDDSKQFIKYYEWTESGNIINPELDSLAEKCNLPNVSEGNHTYYLYAVDDICFKPGNKLKSNEEVVTVFSVVKPNVSFNSDSYCDSKEGEVVTLTVSTSTGTPVKYELYSSTTDKLLKTKETRDMSVSWDLTPSLSEHSYYVKIYDGVCHNDPSSAATELTSIAVHEPVEFSLTAKDTIVCVGDAIQLELSFINGTPSSYTWYGLGSGDATTINTYNKKDTTITDKATAGGYKNYTVVATDDICPSVSVSYQTVYVYEPPVINLYSNKDKIIIGSDVTLYADIVKGEPIAFDWLVEGNRIETTSVNTIDYVPLSTAEYMVYASDGVCPATFSTLNLEVELPTAFTPYLKDGLNDVFMEGFDVVIYDRYGQKLFEGNNGWDGSKGGALADPGVYFYNVVMKNGKVEKGVIEVVKIE